MGISSALRAGRPEPSIKHPSAKIKKMAKIKKNGKKKLAKKINPSPQHYGQEGQSPVSNIHQPSHRFLHRYNQIHFNPFQSISIHLLSITGRKGRAQYQTSISQNKKMTKIKKNGKKNGKKN